MGGAPNTDRRAPPLRGRGGSLPTHFSSCSMARLTRVASSAFSLSQRASRASLPAWASCRRARTWPSSVRSSSFSREKLQARHSASWCRRVSAAKSRPRQPNLAGRQAERSALPEPSRGSPSTPPRAARLWQDPHPPTHRPRGQSLDPEGPFNFRGRGCEFCALGVLQKGEEVRAPPPASSGKGYLARCSRLSASALRRSSAWRATC